MRFQTIALRYWNMNILYVPGIWNHYALKVKIIKPIQDQNVTKAWFSLTHEHKCRDIPTFDSILDTSSPQPNGKQDGGRFIRHIAFDMFAWGLGQSGLWLAHGLVLMLACAYVDSVFTSQSYDISISTSTRRMNLSVFLVLMLIMH